MRGDAGEIKSLQRCLNDMVSVLALPAMWTGGQPAQIVTTLLHALVGMLGLDVAYGRLKAPLDGTPFELLRLASRQFPTDATEELGTLFHRTFGDDPASWPSVACCAIGDSDLHLVPLRLGLHDEAGLIVAGSTRPDFPRQTERLLLSVAANQAAIGLQEARLLQEQKRTAEEMEWRAAQRTRELDAAVEELKLRDSMLQQLPTAAWSVTADGTPDIVNQSWFDYTGQTSETVRAHPEAWMEMLHPADRQQSADIFHHGIRSGQPFALEARYLRHDNTYRWHLTRAVPIRDSQGKVVRFLGTTTDIEDLRQAQDRLRSTQAELAHMSRVMTMGELTASIAHEVNQPLSGIITNASTCLRMLAADPPNVDGARETARRTIRDGNRAAEVITRLRALFARKEIVAESVDLNEATLEVISLFRSAFHKNRIRLRFELAESLPSVTGDRIQLQQVILNLLTNASDAMTGVEDRPRELVIGTQLEHPDLVRVTVRDNGIGFNPQDVDRLFAAFYTTKRSGMGVGLSVSRSIVEGHRGRLTASANNGPGATFTFCIPYGQSATR